MSGAMDSRAAVFTSSPQSVEVYQAGTWWSGELLGWRHDASGACQMWVRVIVGGVEETAWIDLAALRLPEAAAPAATGGRMDARVKQELPPAQAISALRGRTVPGDAATTAALPLIRDESVAAAPAAASAAGAEVAVRPPAISVTRPGGRRRAPEGVDLRSVTAAGVPVPAGRHRAPDEEGRHRAADTEVLPVVSDETETFAAVPAEDVSAPAAPAVTAPAPAAPVGEPRRATRPHAGAGWSASSARAPRPDEPYGRSEVCAGRVDAEPDLLTRPLRLTDLVPHARRPRVSGSLSGV